MTQMNSLHLKRAIEICEKGGVIAYPTEAVFGLGCLPLLEQSVERILKLKDRSISKGLILVASDMEQLKSFVDLSKIEVNKTIFQDIKNSWPGPVTWIIPAKPTTPEWLTGSHKTLAVRVSAHPVVRSLCEELGPIVSTSANPSSAKPAKTSQAVRAYFHSDVDYVIPAKISNALKPTEIRDAESGNILRFS
jgi:L-threonylcarbamoyladenylate synthase